MYKTGLRLLPILLVGCVLSTPVAQSQQAQPAGSGEQETYGSGFFEELRSIFGSFRNADLVG